MNTVGIRDTDYGQSIFWATGLPVTALVMVLAVAYGYYSDKIQDSFLTAFESLKGYLGSFSRRPSSEGPKRSATWATELTTAEHETSTTIAQRGRPSTKMQWLPRDDVSRKFRMRKQPFKDK